MPTPTDISPDTYVVDTQEMGYRERTAAYVVDADRPTIVDTGLSTGAPHVLDGLDELDVAPEDVAYIALTHIHMDHAGAAGALAEACENATVLCHEFGVDFVSDPAKLDRLVESVHRAVGDLADAYGTMDPIPRDRIRSLSGGETIDLGDRTLSVRHSPGHAPHQVAYFDADSGSLFPGDECGEYIDGEVLPSTPPPNADVAAIRESLDAFEELDLAAIYFPHYGEHTDPQAAIDEYREVLTAWVDRIRRATARGDDVDDIVTAVLAEGHVYADLYDETAAREITRMDVEGIVRYLDDA